MTNEPPDPKSSMWGWIAFQLRFQRIERGLSGDAVAKILGCARSTISRLEAGEIRLKDAHAAKLDKAWRTGGFFQTAIWYARLAPNPGWLASYTEFESRATIIQAYSAHSVPVLLQTPEYARAVLLAGHNADVEGGLARRLARQQRLAKPNPPELWVLLAESVLTWPVGGPETQRAQLRFLLELAERPNVYLRIVTRSSGASEALDGSFKVIEVREGLIGFVEAPSGGRLVMDSEGAHSLRRRFERIGAKAASVDSTADLIHQALEAL
ncbi:helix-turn-helix domain-containing protein [Spirillospora sp. NPDC127200]